MAPPKFRSPFPRVVLSSTSGAELRRLAQGLVADAIDEYEHFLWRQHSTIDTNKWAPVRDADDVRVYQLKRAPTTNHKMHELVVAGTILGDLDDALYGVLSPSTDAMRLLAAYTKDRVSNCALLATIKKPTRAKPFRSLTVKWTVTGHALHVRAFAGKKTDFVLLECTGTKKLSNGETVGFQLLHSVDLPTLVPIAKYERATLSVCTLWRQATDDRVHVYAHAYTSAGDKIKATSESLLATARSLQCAQMKKLAWLMRCKASLLGDDRHRGSSLASSDNYCEVCPSQLGLHASRRSAKAACAICMRLVCSSCRVKRELCTIGTDGRLQEQRLSFCTPCHTIATRATASDVAIDDVVRAARELDGSADGPHAESLGVLEADDSDSSHESHPLDLQAIDQFKRLSVRKAKSAQSSSMGGTLEDDESEWSPAARHRAGAELASLYIMGDA